mgnify:FL=1
MAASFASFEIHYTIQIWTETTGCSENPDIRQMLHTHLNLEVSVSLVYATVTFWKVTIFMMRLLLRVRNSLTSNWDPRLDRIGRMSQICRWFESVECVIFLEKASTAQMKEHWVRWSRRTYADLKFRYPDESGSWRFSTRLHECNLVHMLPLLYRNIQYFATLRRYVCEARLLSVCFAISVTLKQDMAGWDRDGSVLATSRIFGLIRLNHSGLRNPWPYELLY